MIHDISGTREFYLDTSSSAGSIFLTGPQGWCMEFERVSFVAYVASRLDLIPVGLFDFAPENHECPATPIQGEPGIV